MPEAGTEEVLLVPDGAVSGNPGPGGWAAIVIDGDEERELSGPEARTTNQRMEIRGASERRPSRAPRISMR